MFRAPSHSKPKETKGFANKSGNFQYDGNQSMEAQNEIGVEIDLRSIKGSNGDGRMKADKATELKKIETFDTSTCFQKTEKSMCEVYIDTMMMTTPQVRKLVIPPRMSAKRKTEARRKETSVNGSRWTPRKKRWSNKPEKLSSGSRNVTQNALDWEKSNHQTAFKRLCCHIVSTGWGGPLTDVRSERRVK